MSDFWSRRKKAVEASEEAERIAQAEALERTEEAERAEIQAELTEAELLEELGLPDPDAVKSGDDVAAFLVRAVPHHIRNRALRSLWRSNPVLACVDGLNDYDGDFTGNGLNGGILKTSYQVGKGLTAHLEKMARDAEPRAPDPPENAEPDESDEKNQVIHNQGSGENSLDDSALPVESMPVDTVPEAERDPSVRPERRMRFTFEEDDLK